MYVTLKEFTQDLQIFYTFFAFGVNVQVAKGKITPNEMDRFHNALPNVKSAYVTLQMFTQDLQKIYTDISVVSVTLCNSA